VNIQKIWADAPVRIGRRHNSGAVIIGDFAVSRDNHADGNDATGRQKS